MGCDRCNELIAAYRDSASLFRNAVWNVAGAQGPDHRAAVQEMTRLQQTCKDANDALREHMRQAHPRSEGSASS